MEDRSFQRFGGLCAIAAAIGWLVTALLLFLAESAGDIPSAMAQRSSTPPANFVLALAGLLTTAAVVALYYRVRDAGAGWARWASALGILGGVMTAIHGLWDALRYIELVDDWQTGDAVIQTAIATFLGVPNPADPRGLGSFLFVGLFVLVAGWLALRGAGLGRLTAQVGIAAGILLVLLFAAGLANLGGVRPWLAAAGMGVAAPLWWLLAGRDLLRTTEG